MESSVFVSRRSGVGQGSEAWTEMDTWRVKFFGDLTVQPLSRRCMAIRAKTPQESGLQRGRAMLRVPPTRRWRWTAPMTTCAVVTKRLSSSSVE